MYIHGGLPLWERASGMWVEGGVKTERKRGRLTETQADKQKPKVWLKQHFHLLSSSCKYIIILVSHTDRDSFAVPQVFPGAGISSTHQTHKSTCLCSAGSAETWSAATHKSDPQGRGKHIFITVKGERKKSSRTVWLLHCAMQALLEMLSQNRNETKARLSQRASIATWIMANITGAD